MNEKNTELSQLWNDFLKAWPVDRLRSMSLEEYTSSGNQATFTYWIEKKLEKLGSIWGGSAFKFGVYSRQSEKDREDGSGRMYSDDYAWYSKYGNTAEEAFVQVRNEIVSVIDAVTTHDLEAIDDINLGHAFKWKIAFHYQDRDKPQIVPIFKPGILRRLTSSNKIIPVSKMHTLLMDAKPTGQDLLEYGADLWAESERLIPNLDLIDDDSEESFTGSPFYSGLTIGSGSNEYTVKRVTSENLELIKNANGVERFIPMVVLDALCNALDSNKIELADLERRKNVGSEHVFDNIGLNHDKYIMGYDASIVKLCEYYLDQKGNYTAPEIVDLLDAIKLTSIFPESSNWSLCSALLAKRFLIFTGLSGSGKTLQALSFVRWLTPKESIQDVFHNGAEIKSANVTYRVGKSDQTAVEFWNSDDPNEAVKVTLPREMIAEWADYIRENEIPKTTQAREIREVVKAASKFSDQLHSFETHLKAAAFALIEQQNGEGPKNYVLISVGADWTSNENLLGYPNALESGKYCKPDNGVLDLILRAQADSTNPYFLILDEMNLSHVERYFADFLSAMESGEAIHLHDESDADWNGVPAKLSIPKNLFVIGTVNVDETTYMFSPKVLDRANVIEFRVSDEEMLAFLENPVKPNLDAIAGQGAAYGKAFVAAAGNANLSLDEELRMQVSEVLMTFFPALKEAGAEFGYRTAHEICRFVHFYTELSDGDSNFDDAMDAAVMQKLLPKLHGSKKKLGPVLETLLRLCLKESARPENHPIKEEVLTKDNALYPVSLEKLKRMRQRLAEHGFTSFAEA